MESNKKATEGQGQRPRNPNSRLMDDNVTEVSGEAMTRLIAGKGLEFDGASIETEGYQERAPQVGEPKISNSRTLEHIKLNKFSDPDDQEILSTMLGDYSEIEGHAYMKDIPVSQGKLKKLQLRVGTGRQVVEGDLVKVHYIFGAESMDDLIESTYERRRPYRFRVGKGEVIALLDFGVTTMKVGEQAKFLGSSEFGFGKSGVPLAVGVVPPDARVIMQIEVLEAVETKPVHPVGEMSVHERRELSFEELFKYAEEVKAQGNREFKDKDYEQAHSTYKTVLESLDEMSVKAMTPDERQRYLKLRIVVNNNLANNSFKQGKFKKTIKFSKQAIAVPIHSVQKAKSHYWHAKVLFEDGDFQDCYEQAKLGDNISGDKDLKHLMQLAENKVNEGKATEKDLCARMMAASLKKN